MSRPRRQEGEPFDRETRLSAEIGEQAEKMPSFREGDQVIVLVHAASTDGQERYGIGMFGYEHDSHAIADLLMHSRAVIEANGGSMQLIFPSDMAAPN